MIVMIICMGNYGSINKVVAHLVTFLKELVSLVKIMHLVLITVLKFGFEVYFRYASVLFRSVLCA